MDGSTCVEQCLTSSSPSACFTSDMSVQLLGKKGYISNKHATSKITKIMKNTQNSHVLFNHFVFIFLLIKKFL